MDLCFCTPITVTAFGFQLQGENGRYAPSFTLVANYTGDVPKGIQRKNNHPNTMASVCDFAISEQ
jgi:hypothetical protein